jgi:hypothetical protein
VGLRENHHVEGSTRHLYSSGGERDLQASLEEEDNDQRVDDVQGARDEGKEDGEKLTRLGILFMAQMEGPKACWQNSLLPKV